MRIFFLGLLLGATTASGGRSSSSTSILWDPWAPADSAVSAPAPDPEVEPVTAPGILFGLAAVRGYQLLLSPLLGGRCQFDPSCSRYTFSYIQSHGLIPGIWAGADRIARCHGFAESGDYPVSRNGRLADPPGR